MKENKKSNILERNLGNKI